MASVNGNGRSRADEIEQEIRFTRSQMDQTLNALERKFSPGQMVDEALHYVRGSGGSEFAQNLTDTVKSNPLPVTLLGVALSWLMMSEREGSAHQTGRSQQMGAQARGKAHELRDSASGAGQRMSEKAGELGQQARGAAGQFGEQAEHMSESLRDRGMHMRDSMQSQASQMSHMARENSQRAQDTFARMLREEPVALAAVGVAVGAVFGALIPKSRMEDQTLGDSADQLKQQAAETGRTELEKGRKVAERAADTAAQETRKSAKQEAERRQVKPSNAKPGASSNRGHSNRPS